jgi:hypothetical protein
MEWNNGTIFRIYVAAVQNDIINGVFNVPVNISQQLLNNKVFIALENFILYPVLDTDAKKNYWADVSLIQLASLNLPPYIDYTTISENAGGVPPSNTSIFSRVPLLLYNSVENAAGDVVPRFIYHQTLNKDSIMYEMLNNQNALTTGSLNIRLLNAGGNPVPSEYILSVGFTIVIYKPKNMYN